MKGKIYNILLHARQVYNNYNVNIRITRNYKNRLSVILMFGDIEASKINDVKLDNIVLNIPCKMKGIIPQGFNILFK